MNRTTTAICAALAPGALIVASPAAAQPAELNAEAVTAAVRYGLPVIFEGYMTRCFDTLDPEGYASINAERLREKFSDGSDEAWPAAKAMILQMTEKEAGNDMSAVFAALDDDQLRPFVDGLLETMAAQEIKQKDCQTIERGLEILDPLPAENVAELVGFVVELGMSLEDDGGNTSQSANRQRKLREQQQERSE